ncbi:hypothetical protein As57867_017259, partial [Aphanomyces stellatus]
MTVLNTQPATVVVEAGNSVWRNYKSGIVSQCPGSQSDHAVIAVGYGSKNGDFFKIKNSWGAQWGDNGYIYLKRGGGGKGMCNVVEGISYPELSGSPKPTSNSPTSYSPKPTSGSPTPTSSKPSPSTKKPSPPSPSTSYPNRSTPSPSGPVAPTTTKPRCTKRPKTKKPMTTTPNSPTTKQPSPPSPPSPKPSTYDPKPSTSGPKPSTNSPPSPPSPPSGNGMQDQLIAQTNKIRAAHGLTPVTWDATLATKMQSWAASCPGFQHGGPSGWQNLATNTPCGSGKKDCNSIVGAAWMWYDQEETKWNYDSNQCNGGWAT